MSLMKKIRNKNVYFVKNKKNILDDILDRIKKNRTFFVVVHNHRVCKNPNLHPGENGRGECVCGRLTLHSPVKKSASDRYSLALATSSTSEKKSR